MTRADLMAKIVFWVSQAKGCQQESRRLRRAKLDHLAGHQRGMRDGFMLAARSILRSEFRRDAAKFRNRYARAAA